LNQKILSFVMFVCVDTWATLSQWKWN